MTNPFLDRLEHDGVKGMRWGVRRDGRPASKRKANRSILGESDDRAEVSVIRKKPVRAMSNSELKKANERLQLEKTYSELTKGTSAIKRGTKLAQDLMEPAKKANELYALGKSPLVQDGIKLMRARMN